MLKVGDQGGKQGVEWFDSVQQFRDVAKARTIFKRRNGDDFSAWHGVKDWAEVDKLVDNGWQKGGDKLSARFDQAMDRTIITQRAMWQHSVSGAFPCVPSYLSGSPESMRNRRIVNSARGPVRMFVSMAASSNVRPEQMIERGMAIAELALYLSTIRPVELFVVADTSKGYGESGGNYYIPIIPLGISPFDLNSLAYALAHPSLFRVLMFRARNVDDSVPWALNDDLRASDLHNPEKVHAAYKPILDLTEDDMFFPWAMLGDPLLRDPQGWLRKNLIAQGLINAE